MNKWLVLEMDGNRKWLFCITWQQPLPCPGKCYRFNYHQLSPMVERAGIFIIWAIPSPHLAKPWAGHTEAKQPVPCGGQGCHWSPRAQGAVRLQSRTFHMARPGTSQLCWLSPGYWLALTKGIWAHSNNGPATSRDCAVSPTAGVTMT